MTPIEQLNAVLARRSIQLNKAIVSNTFREFVCSLGCIKCGIGKEIDPNHIVEKGPQGQNADDYFCVGFCRECHILYHNLTREGYEKEFNINLTEAWWLILRAYLLLLETGQGINTVIVPDMKVKKSTRKNRTPFSRTCNTPEDFSKYQPKEL